MPRNAYSEIDLDITWHTKQRAAMIVDGIEPQLHKYLQKSQALGADGQCRNLVETSYQRSGANLIHNPP